MPVVTSTDQPESCSTPASAIRTVPATGLTIRRTQACEPLSYRFTSWNVSVSPSPVPSAWSIGVIGVDGRPDLRWSPQSFQRKPCRRPLRASKKAMTAARSSARRMP